MSRADNERFQVAVTKNVSPGMEHYHRERAHQGLCNQLIVPLRIPRSNSEPVCRRTCLGGMLSYYERAAA